MLTVAYCSMGRPPSSGKVKPGFELSLREKHQFYSSGYKEKLTHSSVDFMPSVVITTETADLELPRVQEEKETRVSWLEKETRVSWLTSVDMQGCKADFTPYPATLHGTFK